MLPADKSKAENRAPGKDSPSVVAFINPRPQLQSITTPISIKQNTRKKQNPRGHSRVFALPISNGASPIASASGFRLGATPRGPIYPNRPPQNKPAKQDISTLLGLGHFYFALTPGLTSGGESGGESCQNRSEPSSFHASRSKAFKEVEEGSSESC
jgi:hypothetical protein